MPLPAARVGDPHACPAHGPSPIAPAGAPTVLVGNQPAARKGDFAVCSSGADPITEGSPTVLIGNQPAARQTERCAHGGTVVAGFPTVLIGNPAIGPDGRAVLIPPECAFLKDFGNTAIGGKLDRLRDHFTWSTPQPAGEVTIPEDGAKVPMSKRDVWIRGHKVSVYEPAGGTPAGRWLPTADMMAKSLATLSDEQLRNTKEVYLVPHDGPPTPTGGTAVANYKDGTVRYFTRKGEHPQADIDWAMQHETGHAYSWGEVWKKDPAAIDVWKEAMRTDGRSVTAYGDSHFQEDFAEFILLYHDVAGTPCEASARALFPNRYREMEKLLAQRAPVRNPAGVAQPY
jgi:uncharacterized Zn-binding protein involved in type VI secretion